MDTLHEALEGLMDLKLLLVFVLVIVPGFLSVRAYESVRGNQPRKINESLVDVVIYGFATVAISAPFYYLLLLIPDARGRALAVLSAVAIFSLTLPILLAALWCKIQRSLAKLGFISDPDPKPWDRVFHSIKSEKLDLGLILTLPDGRRLGGRFGRENPGDGFASSYPADEQILIGELWLISEEGRFIRQVEGSRGLLIDKKDVLTIEFVDWNAAMKMLEPLAAAANQPDMLAEGNPQAEPKIDITSGKKA